mmetsp:Transcript_43449/g.115316  ORF Transcript_43449/g.115316 Transcript_43449/m.115316 type:complete len:280 (+) Transcript_43449:229-1068(+)
MMMRTTRNLRWHSTLEWKIIENRVANITACLAPAAQWEIANLIDASIAELCRVRGAVDRSIVVEIAILADFVSADHQRRCGRGSYGRCGSSGLFLGVRSGNHIGRGLAGHARHLGCRRLSSPDASIIACHREEGHTLTLGRVRSRVLPAARVARAAEVLAHPGDIAHRHARSRLQAVFGVVPDRLHGLLAPPAHLRGSRLQQPHVLSRRLLLFHGLRFRLRGAHVGPARPAGGRLATGVAFRRQRRGHYDKSDPSDMSHIAPAQCEVGACVWALLPQLR